MAEFKPVKLPLSKVESTAIVEGQFLVTTDAPCIFVDISDAVRKQYNEINIVTESERKSMLAPIEGFYFTSDIKSLWYCKDGIWTDIAPAYEPATTFADGLLTSEDFEKLSKVTVGEMKYLTGVTSSIQDQLNKRAAKSILKAINILSSAWTGDTAPYSVTIQIPDITTTTPIEVALPGTETEEETLACANARIIRITQAAGSLTLYAYGDKPAVDIPICVIIRGDLK